MRLRAVVPALLAVAAQAAVGGAPEAGPSGLMPIAALNTSNDMFANGLGNHDDFRTAGLGGHLRLGGLVLAVDGAMLTDRDAGTRSDELVAVAGWNFQRAAATTGWHAQAFLGGGVRVDGDLHGQEAQNLVHRTINADEVFLTYDDGAVRPTVTGSGALGWLGPAGLGLTGWWGMQLVGAGQWAVEGESVGEFGPRLSLLGQQGALWAGMRLRLRDGEPAGGTVRATGEHEDGLWFDLGTFVVPFGDGDGAWGYQLRTAYNPETRTAIGLLGVVVSPGVATRGRELALEHDLAAYAGGGLGVQLRWHPWPWQDLGRRSAAVADYRFGTEPDGRLRLAAGPAGLEVGADLRHDQFSIGWEEGYRSPDWSGLRFVPWLQAGAGMRQEGVLVEGYGARWSAGKASTVVARGAAGVRLVLGEVFSLGGSLEGWLPAWREDLHIAGTDVTLNDPGWTWGLHLAAHIAW